MKCQLLLCFVLAAVGSLNLFGQSLPSTAPADGLDLLKRVAQHYADAKSYHIEAVEERDSNGEFQRSWQKSVMTAAEAPGNRFHYEGHAFEGEALRIGNDKTVWTYHARQRRYTQKAITDRDSEPKMTAMSESTLWRAEHLRKGLSDLPKHLKSATRLEDAAVSINGREISCYVVRMQTRDMKRTPHDYSLDKKLWIDKANEVIVRIVEHENVRVNMGGGEYTPAEDETTTTFSVVELDRVMPDDFFTFVPPSDARLIQNFPDPRHFGPDLSGEQVPSLKLKSADGKLVSLDSFRGKPVLLDIWATWCSPCVKGLEEIARIYSETPEQRSGPTVRGS